MSQSHRQNKAGRRASQPGSATIKPSGQISQTSSKVIQRLQPIVSSEKFRPGTPFAANHHQPKLNLRKVGVFSTNKDHDPHSQIHPGVPFNTRKMTVKDTFRESGVVHFENGLNGNILDARFSFMFLDEDNCRILYLPQGHNMRYLCSTKIDESDDFDITTEDEASILEHEHLITQERRAVASRIKYVLMVKETRSSSANSFIPHGIYHFFTRGWRKKEVTRLDFGAGTLLEFLEMNSRRT